MRDRNTIWRRTSKAGGCRGFTLIELLIVITIISILAALLLRSLAGSKRQAQQTACLNNVKEMTLAGLMYMTETGQGLPDNVQGLVGYDPNAPAMWWDALAYYGTAGNVRLCPSTLNPPTALPFQPVAGTANRPWGEWNPTYVQPISGSFGMNGYLEKIITPYIYLPALKLSYVFPKPSSVQKPSQTPFFFDEICMDTFPLETDPAATDLYFGEVPSWALGGGRGMGCCTILRHGGPTASSSVPYKAGRPLPGAINMGFDDGHGELVKLKNLWTCYWHLNWNPAKVKAP
jgi:prepilin-type N-terminal cleavage/methylation domain-containing protein